jgi:hypothetical protein
MATDIVETRQDRRLLAADAGLGRVSLLSVLAGVMTAYGTFVLVLAVTAGVLRLLGVDTHYSASDWKDIGFGGGLVAAAVLFVSYLFGGYVAGRMARRAGVTNGLLVFVLGVLFLLGAAALANAATDSGEILRNLRSLGIPTAASEWTTAGLIVGIASLAAMLVGSLAGGALGERWHGKLLTRAVDPGFGPERRVVERRDDWRTSVERPATTSMHTLDDDRDRTTVD